MRSLEQTVAAREVSLNQTAEELVEEIANVTQDAPPMRVSFNAAERTEKMYASGTQVSCSVVVVVIGIVVFVVFVVKRTVTMNASGAQVRFSVVVVVIEVVVVVFCC